MANALHLGSIDRFWSRLFDGADSGVGIPSIFAHLDSGRDGVGLRFGGTAVFSIIWGTLAAGLVYGTVFDRLWGIYYLLP